MKSGHAVKAMRAGPQAIAISLLVVIVATVLYFLLPVPDHLRQAVWALAFGAGALLLAILIATTVRRVLRAGPDVRAGSLIALLCITVLFFSWADDSLATVPGQFADLHTKTDSLYFNISTLATVGFGDVHAVGQLARSAVTLQMIFNLVIIGTAAAIVSGIVRGRATRRAGRTQDGQPGASGPG